MKQIPQFPDKDKIAKNFDENKKDWIESLNGKTVVEHEEHLLNEVGKKLELLDD